VNAKYEKDSKKQFREERNFASHAERRQEQMAHVGMGVIPEIMQEDTDVMVKMPTVARITKSVVRTNGGYSTR
jgi:hypothetical protein